MLNLTSRFNIQFKKQMRSKIKIKYKMINVRFKTEKMKVFEYFVKEVSNELNIEFDNKISEFSRGVIQGKKYKQKTFESPISKYKSNLFELSFLPYSDSSVEIWKINVRKRGKGFGSELMSKILDVSDRTGIKVKLVPTDYDCDENFPNGYITNLKNWYTIGLGFKRPTISFDPYYTYYPEQEYKMVG